ncbi:MAG TPA: hypothetical protein VEI02_12675 [Planctomycetota bacterium]|nr:hypothetical protein [Planctomycetota bacterium]
MGRWLDRLPKTTTPWLLERACPPIKLRTLTEILERPADDWDVARAREGVNQFPPAVAVSRLQSENGVWLGKLLDFEPPNFSRKKGPGTVNQFLLLVECGWDLTHPICHCTGLLLKQYLNGDDGVDLHELKGYLGEKPSLATAMRDHLKRIAAALLARAGLRDDAHLDAVGEDVLNRLERQYANPAEPGVYDGSVEVEEGDKKVSYRRLRDGAIPVDHFTLYLLAFWQGARADARRKKIVSQTVKHLFAAKHDPPRLVVEAEGKRLLKLRIPHVADNTKEQYADKKIGYLLHDLELLARTGTLLENPKAVELLEWLVSLVDPDDGSLNFDPAIDKHQTRSLYHYFPLEDSWRGKHKKYTDATFRLALILKLLDVNS